MTELVGLVLLLAGLGALAATGALAACCLRLRSPTSAPWALLLTLSVTIVWDPFRGRFLVLGVALAAATWGLFLRSRIASAATAAIGATALTLSLANYYGKPTGLGEIWTIDDPPPVSVKTIWTDRHWEVQTRLRPRTGESTVLRFVEEELPAAARLAVAPSENDLLFPYFETRLSRHVSLVSRSGGEVSGDAGWLVVSPSAHVRQCTDAWRPELVHGSGWRIERRIGPDTCSDIALDER